MQITVTNQKTKLIRSACFEAGVGSQGTKRATAVATAAAPSPTATRRTSTPLRTSARLRNPAAQRRLETGVTSALQGAFSHRSRRVDTEPRKETYMGIGVSLLLVAAGAILVWGVNGDIGSVNEDAIGWILMIVGIVGLVLSMIFWSSWAGPGYWSRRRGGYAEDAPPPGPGY